VYSTIERLYFLRGVVVNASCNIIRSCDTAEPRQIIIVPAAILFASYHPASPLRNPRYKTKFAAQFIIRGSFLSPAQLSRASNLRFLRSNHVLWSESRDEIIPREVRDYYNIAQSALHVYIIQRRQRKEHKESLEIVTLGN